MLFSVNADYTTLKLHFGAKYFSFQVASKEIKHAS